MSTKTNPIKGAEKKPDKPVNIRDIHPTTLKELNKMQQARHDVQIENMNVVIDQNDKMLSKLDLLLKKDVILSEIEAHTKALSLSPQEGEQKPVAYTTELALEVSSAMAGTIHGTIDASVRNIWGDKGGALYRKPHPGVTVDSVMEVVEDFMLEDMGVTKDMRTVEKMTALRADKRWAGVFDDLKRRLTDHFNKQ